MQTNCREPAMSEVLLNKLAFCFYGRKVYREFAERLPLKGDEQVLDFGCGLGTVAYYTANRLPNGQLTCLDVSKRWLKSCRKTLRRFTNVTFHHGGADVLVVKKEQFDLIFCHFVLHDICDEELEHVMFVLANCLKPGGVFVFRDPMTQVKKLNRIKALAEQNGLIKKDSRITDVPLMGNTLENRYIKQ